MWGEVWGSVGERCGRVYGVSVKGTGKCIRVWGSVEGSVDKRRKYGERCGGGVGKCMG